MDNITSFSPALAVLASLVGAIMILVFRKQPNIREGVSLAAGISKFLIIATMIPAVMEGRLIELRLWDVLPGLPIMFRVDAFGLLFGLIASFLWIFTTLYSIGYMRTQKEHAQTRYFFCFAIALSSTIGVAFSANLFTLFIFYEILTISTYPLVVHIETPEAMRAGRKYLLYLLTAGVFFLFSILAVYHYTGTTDFAFGGILEGKGIPENMLKLLFVTFMIGSAKAAFMPLHSWLPSAMIAPTPVSALLHAVAVVKVGVFTATRIILYVFGIDVMKETGLALAMAYVAAFTIIVASLFALTHDNLKKRLAYSTISQLSYIILGVVMLTPSGITGGMLHILNHAFMKITLFFCAGAIIVAAGKEKISEMNGIGKQMPLTMLAFTLGALGMAGTPATAGFVSKWFLLIGSVEIGQIPLLLVLLASTFLNVAYFFPVIINAFFKRPDKELSYREAPLFMLIPLILTGIFSIILGILPDEPLAMVRIAVANLMGGK
ncbi:MAG: monovalent cation/H+ antiporter subunit D family protein [Candidatus Methanoperedens sp.]|nr:monovalent cation/H+ antiporter subunit D family protein [Candidatus Methanoperedens sp.]MCZ7361453.1 monovalent cation/H+ antiporter subunit D family protein [Candidatus Methanoperedens sp.]HLB70752.1 monovalent cation/H+ antiporter subunit D family protein [Candidatus Methanoperedens sp.]